jgi:hypothetical protein
MRAASTAKWLRRSSRNAPRLQRSFGASLIEQSGQHLTSPRMDEPDATGTAALTMLAVRPIADGWEARCVVDV